VSDLLGHGTTTCRRQTPVKASFDSDLGSTLDNEELARVSGGASPLLGDLPDHLQDSSAPGWHRAYHAWKESQKDTPEERQALANMFASLGK
jgi:hypothetical protein